MIISANFKRNVLALSLFIAMLMIGFSSVIAQNYSIKDRWNVKLDYSRYPPLGPSWQDNDFSPSFQTELNYGIWDYIEVGSYFGIGKIETGRFDESDEDSSISVTFNTKKTNALFYGISSNLHLLPFLVKSENFRFDVYVSGKLGGFYRLSEEGMSPGRGHEWDYGMYMGAAYYLGRHLGVFGEYGIGNYTNHRFGLSLKF